MKSLSKFLFLCGLIVFVAFGCNEEDNEELITNNCPEWSASPSSPYFDPIWHPSGDIIGFNHMPLTEIDYTYGYDCPWQADYKHDIDSMGFWLINADGTNQRRVLPYYLQTPAWSPDGNWIAFSQGAQIFKMPFDSEKFDTANIVQLTFDGRNFFPSWSPDGEWIAYDSDMESLTGLNFIWKMKSYGSEKKRIAYTPTLGETRVPSWGPDGKHIVYINYKDIRLDESQGTLWIINIENNNKRQLTYNVFNLIQ